MRGAEEGACFQAILIRGQLAEFMQTIPSVIFGELKQDVNGTEIKDLSGHAFNDPLSCFANFATTA